MNIVSNSTNTADMSDGTDTRVYSKIVTRGSSVPCASSIFSGLSACGLRTSSSILRTVATARCQIPVPLDHLIDRLDEEAPWDRTLAGGEKQRLAFARVFLANPDIIVLDEATAALDPESRDRLMQLVSEQPSETALISVGHRPELESYHNRKVVLERRRGETRLVNDISVWHRNSACGNRFYAGCRGQKQKKQISVPVTELSASK
jgi:ABC-type methionine transport system ATPase subunit